MLRGVTRIAFIGAGSVEFTRDLLGDLLSFAGPRRAATIALHDIDPERLDDRRGDGALDRRAARRAARRSRRTSTGARRSTGADFAINMIQVGGHAATLLDFEIPARHGLRQTIGDTLGIGGIFRALRTIPVMLGIGARHGRAVPGRAGCSTTRTRWRCCARPTRTARRTRRSSGSATRSSTRRARSPSYVGVPFEEVTFLGAGVNHQAFILRFERDGEDLYPRARRARSRPTRSCSATCASSCTGASATSRPSRASTRPSTCRG